MAPSHCSPRLALQAGHINGLAISADGRTLVAAVGQEHKLGRWSRLSGVRNRVQARARPAPPRAPPRMHAHAHAHARTRSHTHTQHPPCLPANDRPRRRIALDSALSAILQHAALCSNNTLQSQ